MTAKQIYSGLLIVIFVLISLIFFQACEKTGNEKLSGTVELSENSVKKLNYLDKTVALTATSFTESRCPKNVQCVWAGNAMVSLTFKTESEEQTIRLCLGDCFSAASSDNTTINIFDKTFKVKLLRIDPYPETQTTKTVTRTATIHISE